MATGGFVGAGFAEEIAVGWRVFPQTGSPRNLTIVYAAGQETAGEGPEPSRARGLGGTRHWGHIGLAPKALPADPGKQDLRTISQGVVSHFFRDVAATARDDRPSASARLLIRVEGSKINNLTKREGRSHQDHQIDGGNTSSIRPSPSTSCHRGTTADTEGSVTMEREALARYLSMAMAAKNSGGFVIAQVERIAERGTLPARSVKVQHPRRLRRRFRPENLADLRRVLQSVLQLRSEIPMLSIPPLPLDERKIIARRVAASAEPTASSTSASACPRAWHRWPTRRRSSNTSLTAERGHRSCPTADLISARRPAWTASSISEQFDLRQGRPGHLAYLGAAGWTRRECQRQPLQDPARRAGRVHQHQPEFEEDRVHGTLQ